MVSSALSITGLTKVYENGIKALNGIDLEVAEGDFFALLGANGAGKSTTIGVVCSLVLKTAGQVKIFDCDIDTDFPRARGYLGVIPQEFNFNNFERVLDIVVTQAGYYGVPPALARQRAEKYLNLLGLWEQRKMQAIHLSGGMKRRLMIARALLHEPRLLILDEPTAGVDVELRHSMWEFLRKINAEGTTIIMTTHYLEEAENLCRNVAIIDQGNIIHNGAMREVASLLSKQIYVIDTVAALDSLPDMPRFNPRINDSHTLEVSLSEDTSLDALFTALKELKIEVAGIRPKRNRLEELFISLINDPSRKRNESV